MFVCANSCRNAVRLLCTKPTLCRDPEGPIDCLAGFRKNSKGGSSCRLQFVPIRAKKAVFASVVEDENIVARKQRAKGEEFSGLTPRAKTKKHFNIRKERPRDVALAQASYPTNLGIVHTGSQLLERNKCTVRYGRLRKVATGCAVGPDTARWCVRTPGGRLCLRRAQLP
eukprot:6630408-Pyramimonas_sp.AAC.4